MLAWQAQDPVLRLSLQNHSDTHLQFNYVESEIKPQLWNSWVQGQYGPPETQQQTEKGWSWVEQGTPLLPAVEAETGGSKFEANNEFQGGQSYSLFQKRKPKNKQKLGVIKFERFVQQSMQV